MRRSPGPARRPASRRSIAVPWADPQSDISGFPTSLRMAGPGTGVDHEEN